jgi:hypothetical protein
MGVEEEMRYRLPQRGIYDPQLPAAPPRTSSLHSESLSSATLPAAPPPLHFTHSSGSFTRLPLPHNPSQSSLTGSMPTTARTRSRGGTLQSFVSAESTTAAAQSPSSRTSMDKALGIFRIRSASAEDAADPAVRAASIRAARIAYEEREEAKAAKAEKEEARRGERERRKAGRREDRLRRKSDAAATKRERANSSASAIAASNEKDGDITFAAKGYDASRPANVNSLPEQVAKPPSRSGGAPSGVRFQREGRRKRGARSAWLGFMAWFRKRLLRLSRAMHLSS